MKKYKQELNFKGVKSFTTDMYYDIINGYYTNEIKDENTKKELLRAIEIIEELAAHLCDNDLVG